MNKTIDENLHFFIEKNYATYGKYINLVRTVPGTDGLKPVYRRSLMGAFNAANGTLAPTIAVLGEAQRYHPFGDKSTLDVIANMVRLGMITGDGDFGCKSFPKDIPPSAPRYTQCGLSKDQSDYFFRLSKYAPLIEGETQMEPEFLITPVPIQLVFGGFNFGLGLNGRTPAFTYKSLIEAYFKDDPNLLESNFGYELIKENCDFKELWETGTGSLRLKSKCVKINDDKILLASSGEIFVPNTNVFKADVEAGQVIIGNESSKEINITVSRIPRARNINMQEVYLKAKKVSETTKIYNILVVENNRVRRIGIREWLDLTVNRYVKYFNQSKEERINETNFRISVLKILPVVARYILDDMQDDQIIKNVPELTEEILKSIKAKTVGSLRKSNWEPEIKSLENQIISINKEDPIESINSFCDTMFSGL